MSLTLQQIKDQIRETLKFEPATPGADFGYTEFYVLLSRLNQLRRHFNTELFESTEDEMYEASRLENMWTDRVDLFPSVVCLPRDRWGRKPIEELIIKEEDYVAPEVKVSVGSV